MDLIDEEDVAFTEIRESTNQIARFLERGSGGAADIHAELSRDELSESCLAETGRTEEECVVERLAAGESGVDVDAQRLVHAILPYEFGQALRPKREFDYALVGYDFRGRDFSACHAYRKLTEAAPGSKIFHSQLDLWLGGKGASDARLQVSEPLSCL